MKRWLSLFVSLAVMMSSGLVVSMVRAMSDADEITQMLYAAGDEVSVDVQLDEMEQAMTEDNSDSLVSDTDQVVESFIDESGNLDVSAVEDAIDDLLEQTDVLIGDESLDVDTLDQSGELDKILEQMDILEGQRSFLPERLKDKMRDFAKARRKLVARFQELKSQLKEIRMDANKRVRDFKGGLRTLLRRAKELNKDQKQEAFERIKRQAKDAVDEHKDMVKERVKDAVDMMREKCKEDAEECKMQLQEIRESRMQRQEKVIEKLDARCEMAADQSACQEKVDGVRQKMMDRNMEMKDQVDELRAACEGNADSEECMKAKQDTKDFIKQRPNGVNDPGFQFRRKGVMDPNSPEQSGSEQ